MELRNPNAPESSSGLERVKVVSFDAEGTLVTTDFSLTVWHEAIPSLYAEKNGVDVERARQVVFTRYDEVGDQRLEWYDINYWLHNLELGTLQPVIDRCLHRIRRYPEVDEVLSSLKQHYRLIVCSGTPTELLDPLLEGIAPHFVRVFSSTSDYRELKTPAFFQWVCESLGLDPAEVVHVGDSWQFDYLNARDAGMPAFYLDRSGGHNGSVSTLTEFRDLLLG